MCFFISREVRVVVISIVFLATLLFQVLFNLQSGTIQNLNFETCALSKICFICKVDPHKNYLSHCAISVDVEFFEVLYFSANGKMSLLIKGSTTRWSFLLLL